MAKSRRRPKTPGKRPQRDDERVAEPATEDTGEQNESPEVTPSTPAAQKTSPPWWLFAAIAGIVCLVAYTQYSASSGEQIEDIGLTGVAPPPEALGVRIINRFPHDREAFTQGLLWHEGHLYESTGLRRHSTLRRVELETGAVLESRALEDRLFAEGLARVGDLLYQLTWERGEAHVWTLDGFEHRRTLNYDGEGWGLCHDGEHLVMSDGSARLTFRDPTSFRVRRVVRVRESGRPVDQLNELECVDGVVWANVWHEDRILRIDPTDGRVTGVVEVPDLLEGEEDWDTDVLNGIAWIPDRGHFVITGKRWPRLFEVDFVPLDELEGE
ncbi:MAG: glutaminyl-peptide cyclotransferase [Sandaracinaceae bacterium]